VRSAVIIVCDGNVALIRRFRNKNVYYLFPGGQVEPGESSEEAAEREALEELGVEVRLGDMVAKRTLTPEQVFYEAEIVRGEFGSGSGSELSSTEDSERGSYTPIWYPISELQNVDIRPKSLAEILCTGKLGICVADIQD
jgi:8-oxo-dGTP diphosphatase